MKQSIIWRTKIFAIQYKTDMTHIYLDHILQIYYLIQHHLAMPYTDLLFVRNVYEIIESFSLTHYMNQ